MVSSHHVMHWMYAANDRHKSYVTTISGRGDTRNSSESLPWSPSILIASPHLSLLLATKYVHTRADTNLRVRLQQEPFWKSSLHTRHHNVELASIQKTCIPIQLTPKRMWCVTHVVVLSWISHHGAVANVHLGSCVHTRDILHPFSPAQSCTLHKILTY